MGEGERLRNERRPEDALEPYERALRIWEGIVRDRPTIPFFRAELAATLAAIASIHQQAGRREEARDAWRRTLDLGVPPRDGDARVAFNMSRVYALGSTVDRARARFWEDRALAALRRPWPPATRTAVRSARTPTSTRFVAAPTSWHSSPT